MSKLEELSNNKHKSLKIKPDAAIEFAATQHLLNVRVNEVGQAISSFPVFLMKDTNSGFWKLSAIASFEMGKSLFVQSKKWQAVFTPSMIQTYPFFLMNKSQESNDYTIGIVPESDAFSTENGLDIFESSGKASLQLSKVKSLLEADIGNDIHTFKFGKALDELGLCKSINLVLTYQDGAVEKLQGLCTIDEDKFNTLNAEQLEALNKQGYLLPIHALLLSIYQLNALIQRNNADSQFKQIQQIKIEVNK